MKDLATGSNGARQGKPETGGRAIHPGSGRRKAPLFPKGRVLRQEEVAVVGDAVHDLAMGRAAGVGLTVGVLSGTSAREDLAGLADAIVTSIADLPARPELGSP